MFYCLLLLMILLVFSLVKPNKDTVVARVQGTTMLVIVLFGLVLLKSKYAVFLKLLFSYRFALHLQQN